MAIDRKYIGLESEERILDIEKGQLRLFSIAVGETNLIYMDEDAAKAAGYPSIPAPPTFAFSMGLLAPAKVGNVTEIVTNLGSVLHGEQLFDYRKMVFAGDRVRLKTKTVDIFDKKGGKLEFVVQDTSVHNQHGDLCVTSRMTLAVRN